MGDADPPGKELRASENLPNPRLLSVDWNPGRKAVPAWALAKLAVDSNKTGTIPVIILSEAVLRS